MLSFDRLSGDSGCIELDFLEREATPEPATKIGIRLHWWPEYEVTNDDDMRSITPHYARPWFSSWFRLQARMPEPWVQYMRGDVQSSEVDNTRDAFHRYIHAYYEQIEDEYRDNVFPLGL